MWAGQGDCPAVPETSSGKSYVALEDSCSKIDRNFASIEQSQVELFPVLSNLAYVNMTVISFILCHI